MPAQVIQVLPGAGVAIGFDMESNPDLMKAIAAARQAGSNTGAEPEHHLGSAASTESDNASHHTEHSSDRGDARGAPSHVGQRVRSASQGEKIQLALHGNHDERAAILRDSNRSLHKYVLRNPGIRMDEVAHIARMTAVSPEVLNAIAERREWVRRPEIAAALVRNPKTPTTLAVKLLGSVSPNELRNLAKSSHVRSAVQAAARKRLLQKR
ncbi:MAG: hypothetical protein AAGC55_18935 [Myxococcota bacterium]